MTRSEITTSSAPSWGFPGSSDGKESACSAGDLGSIPGSGRSPGEGNGSSLQYLCLENSMDRRAWRATVYGVAKSCTGLSDFAFIFMCDQWFNQSCLCNGTAPNARKRGGLKSV